MLDSLFEDAANDNDYWAGCDLESLPRTAGDARAVGSRYFFTGERCVHGHLSPKYEKGGRCVDCSMHSSASASSRTYSGARARVRTAIKITTEKGFVAKTYVPAKPCKNGHSLRWVASGNCVECDAETRVKYKEVNKSRRLQKEYGITLEERDAIVRGQDFKCAVCADAINLDSRMHVDHCHVSGSVRGVLCSKCNQGIGLFNDDPNRMRAAADYVERHMKERAVA